MVDFFGKLVGKYTVSTIDPIGKRDLNKLRLKKKWGDNSTRVLRVGI